MIKIPSHLKVKRKIPISEKQLINFENKIFESYNKSLIPYPIHLSGNNEKYLIKIFSYIQKTDYVFSNWRSHYHAILHGLSSLQVKNQIFEGKSMSITGKNFFASSIVGGCIPIALGTAYANKFLKKNNQKVWCFIGDMTYETGIFHESYKYSKNYDLPLTFIIEDNDFSTNTPTKEAWGKKSKIPNDVIYYKYKRKYPHHGTGTWVLF